jgi:hypothetical protein
MSGRKSLIVVCGVAILIVASGVFATSASAQGFGSGGYGLGFYNYGNSGINQASIPYYALYPPVYYSFPVPRTYGYSPFAYPPGVMTPEVAPTVAAVEFHNPYVPQPSEPAPSDRTVSTAKTYYNPYVQQARADSNPPRPSQAGQ